MSAVAPLRAVPTPTFQDVLHCHGPASDRAEAMRLYGWLVGRWETEVIAYEPSGAKHTRRGEIHAGWVLEGRAIQDVWMIPRLVERTADAAPFPVAGNWYGTTLRVYDPGLDAWHILWSDPVTQVFTRQIGRARGSDVVQEGTSEDGVPMRWTFTDIESSSFHWLGEFSPDGGKTWRLQVEVFARRAR